MFEQPPKDDGLTYGHLEKNARIAEAMSQSHPAAESEAMVLNEKHKRLQKAVEDAQKALADFEREKLGMHREEDEQ